MSYRPRIHATNLIENLSVCFAPFYPLFFWADIRRESDLTRILRLRDNLPCPISWQNIQQQISTDKRQFFKESSDIVSLFNRRRLTGYHISSIHFLDHFHNRNTRLLISIDQSIVNGSPTSVFRQQGGMNIHRKVNTVQ